MYNLKDITEQIIHGLSKESDKAVALHNYVRDTIKFGISKYFDATTPDYLLRTGTGYCNPKSRLMAELFKTAGFEAFQHFVVSTLLRE